MASLLETARDHPHVLNVPEPQVLLTGYGDKGINYELRAWVAGTKQMVSVASALRLKIWDVFAEKQFEMPYPQRAVHIVTGAEYLDSTIGEQ